MKIKSKWGYLLILFLLLSAYPVSRKLANIVQKPENVNASESATPVNITTANEFIVYDHSITDDKQVSLVSSEVPKEISKIGEDGSEIKTSYDAYGNKTEVRLFSNDSRLKQLLVRTSADGQKQVYVYGQNGEVESLPDKILERVLTAPASEIASVAGIINTKQTKVSPTFAAVNQIPNGQTNPLPNYQDPNQIQTQEIKPEVENNPAQTDTPKETNKPETEKSSKNNLNKTEPQKKVSENLQNFLPKRGK